MEEIKKGDIVVNYNRQWIGIFDRWNPLYSNCFWQWSLYQNNLSKESNNVTFSSALHATEAEKDKFKKALLQKGYSYCDGEVILEL